MKSYLALAFVCGFSFLLSGLENSSLANVTPTTRVKKMSLHFVQGGQGVRRETYSLSFDIQYRRGADGLPVPSSDAVDEDNPLTNRKLDRFIEQFSVGESKPEVVDISLSIPEANPDGSISPRIEVKFSNGVEGPDERVHILKISWTERSPSDPLYITRLYDMQVTLVTLKKGEGEETSYVTARYPLHPNHPGHAYFWKENFGASDETQTRVPLEIYPKVLVGEEVDFLKALSAAETAVAIGRIQFDEEQIEEPDVSEFDRYTGFITGSFEDLEGIERRFRTTGWFSALYGDRTAEVLDRKCELLMTGGPQGSGE